VNLWWLKAELISDLHGVLIVLDIELSRELVHLPVHLVLGEPESILAALGGKSIDKSIFLMSGGNIVKGDKGFDVLLVGGDDSEEKS
jgi:hypothetical protein